MNRMNARWTTGIAAALFAVAAAGCGSKLLGISASIVVSPDSVAFGSASVGVAQSKTITVTNAGSAQLTVTAIKVATNPNNDLTVANVLTNDCSGNSRSGSTTLAAGECATFSVVWSPMSTEAAAGSIEVDSSDPTTPVITLPVTGNAASPDLEYCLLDSTGAETSCSNLGVNPPVLPVVDFGSATPNVATTQTVRIKNNGMATLTFTSQPATNPAQPIFSVASGSIPNLSLDPNTHADFVLSVTPTANGSVDGTFVVTSSDLRDPTLNIPLQVFVAGGAVCVSPTSGLNFGTVTIGQTQKLQITFTNCGTADLVVNSFTFNGINPTTNQFTITSGTLPANGAAFAQGATLTFEVTYAPTAVRSDKASFDYIFTYASDATRALNGSVDVVGTGAAAVCGSSGATDPVANIVTYYGTSAAGATTQFSPTTSPSPVVPLDYVKLSGSTSTGTGTLTYTWQLVSQPAGSTTSLQTPGSVQATMQTLVSGAYTVSLTVKDASSCIGTASVTINVVSTGAVHIELTWAESCGDLDLHYVNPGNSICSGTDCGYYNKNTTWGATLDHDDQWGNGPENITQSTGLSNGVYQIWVYYYSSSPDGGGGSGTCGNTTPTVNVYLSGTLAGTYTLTGFENQMLWHTADVTVAGSGTQITVAAASTSEQSGGACVND